LQCITAAYLFFAFAGFDSKNSFLIYLVTALGYALVAALNSPQGVYFSALFPARFRSSGVMLPREISSALGGGLSPLIASALVFATGSAFAVSIFCAALLSISFLASGNIIRSKDER
jgi:hypothetical protein